MEQGRAKWFSRPQGPPSGVCTGQRKPQLSGSSFLTVVVFMVVKNWPLWMLLKCVVKRKKLILSATTEYPDTCMRSRPVEDTRLPVASR